MTNLPEEFEKAVHGPWTTTGLDVQYRIERTATEIRVYFQHTKSWIDWILDASPWPVKDREGQYRHAGFYLAHLSAYRQVMLEAIGDKAPGETLPVKAFGYSLGGPLAGQFVRELTRTGYASCAYTFASPRWSWGKDSPIDCVTNIRVLGDLLAAAFPRWLGYRDSGEDIWIGKISPLSPWKHSTDAYRKELVRGIRGLPLWMRIKNAIRYLLVGEHDRYF